MSAHPALRRAPPYRTVLTVIGAIAIMAGALLTWDQIEGEEAKGTDLGWEVFFTDNQVDLAPGIRVTEVEATGGYAPYDQPFLTSAGFGVLLIGLVALAGLASSRGWPTRIAGVLAIAASLLFTISVFRADAVYLSYEGGRLASLGIGIWLVLAGGLLGLVGGFRSVSRRDQRPDRG